MSTRRVRFNSRHEGIHWIECEIKLELTGLQSKCMAVLNVQSIKFSFSVKSTFALK